MSNLETLKQELILQKSIIEEKGGNVTIANTNPSPSEITSGIRTIEMPDFESATATEGDVKIGKTFFAGNLEIKTGTMPELIDEESLKHIFLYDLDNTTTTEVVYYALPESITKVREYLFYESPNYINLKLPDNTTEIGDYAFYNCTNFTFTNMADIPLEKISSYGLHAVKGIDLANMWPTLKTIELRGLCNTIYNNTCINLPALKTIGSYAFASTTTKKYLSHIDMSKITATFLDTYAFMNLSCDCDLVIPYGVTSIGGYCFHKGSFNSVTVPSTITNITDYAFGGSSADALSEYKMKSFTFEGATPPTVGPNFISTYHVQNGAKIYVPDAAVEAYKAYSKMSKYVDIIFPVSQKP